MSIAEQFELHFASCPLIAVLRGVRPDEVEVIGEALVEAGIRIVEVPLNSPDPLDSIERLARRLQGQAIVGAGTVLRAEQVEQVRGVGGQLIVSPNTNPAVIAATVAAGMISCPGYFTPTEAFAALDAGAHALKFFPAEAGSPAVIKAQRAVLPKDALLIVVGGVAPEAMARWTQAGANGFGLGSGVYVPGQDAATTLDRARAYVAALAAD
ncbi:MAG: 2-dehydro-3-deoxy-6-phosphogalactonate aldolase [Pseudomonadota bacterium]